MSLDVWLTMPGVQNLEPGPRIFICEDGSTREISREEWDQRFPGREPVTVDVPRDSTHVFEWNITHNLNQMAGEAGIYEPLWRPDEIGIAKARELIEPLEKGLALLRAEPDRFKAFNPKNGWGCYENLVEFVEKYLAACKEYPDADIDVSR